MRLARGGEEPGTAETSAASVARGLCKSASGPELLGAASEVNSLYLLSKVPCLSRHPSLSRIIVVHSIPVFCLAHCDERVEGVCT